MLRITREVPQFSFRCISYKVERKKCFRRIVNTAALTKYVNLLHNDQLFPLFHFAFRFPLLPFTSKFSSSTLPFSFSILLSLCLDRAQLRNIFLASDHRIRTRFWALNCNYTISLPKCSPDVLNAPRNSYVCGCCHAPGPWNSCFAVRWMDGWMDEWMDGWIMKDGRD